MAQEVLLLIGVIWSLVFFVANAEWWVKAKTGAASNLIAAIFHLIFFCASLIVLLYLVDKARLGY